MVTGAEVTFGFKALKDALGLIKQAKDLTEASAIHGKVIEMQALVAEALSEVIDARQAHAAQLEHINELEKEIARLKAWDGENDRYELKDVSAGAFVYVPKAGMEGGEPPHWLCAHCYQHTKKSLMQPQGRTADNTWMTWKCPACGSGFRTHWATKPSK